MLKKSERDRNIRESLHSNLVKPTGGERGEGDAIVEVSVVP